MPPELPAPWPEYLTPPRELHAWLHQEACRRQAEGGAVLKHLTTLRWLVLAELDRTAPETAAPPFAAQTKEME